MKTISIFRRQALLVALVVVLAVAAVAKMTPAHALETKTIGNHVSNGYIRGDASFSVTNNGDWRFSGHLHNNGVSSFTAEVVCAFKTTDNSALAIGIKRHIKGDAETVFGGNKSLNWDSGWQFDANPNGVAGEFSRIDRNNPGACVETEPTANFEWAVGRVAQWIAIDGFASIIVVSVL